ncbi:MAG: UPF0182 family protein, partial [Rhodococcus sp.]|nr:UPF0182 family protein [Rhodococcus sp. (in: high G+C Gram-positive bacteria)]
MDSSEHLLPTSRRSRVLIGVLVAFILALLTVPRFVLVYTDWLWFGEVGYRNVWTTILYTRIALFAGVTAVIGTIIFFALTLAYRSRPLFAYSAARGHDPLEPYRAMVTRRHRRLAIVISLVIALPFGLHAQSNWMIVQLFVRGGSFGSRDAEFGHDIAFYVFDLPFYRMVLNWLFIVVFLALLANLCAHYLFGGIRLQLKDGLPAITRPARIQVAILLGTFIALKAVAYWFDRYSLLWSGRKEPTFTGAGFTDINAVLPARLIMVAIAVVCAAAFFAAIFLRDIRIPAMAAALLVLSSILVGGIWPALVEQFSVRPNAADRERVYI